MYQGITTVELDNLTAETASYLTTIQKCQVPLVSKDLYQVVMDNAERINKAIDYERDYDYNFFGFKTLEKSYLMRCNGK
jgi:ribonucleoside-diphosphate reductase subunit M1